MSEPTSYVVEGLGEDENDAYYGAAPSTTEENIGVNQTEPMVYYHHPSITTSLPLSGPVATGSKIEWNGLFQNMLERSDDTQEKRLAKHEDISTLNHNFVSMAKQLGKIIITEAFLPKEVQTIKPMPLGGVAGGCKYQYNGILFKLQTDWKQIYGSHHNAMKSGSLELKGLMRYYGFNDIHVPLMAIIDYRGFRLVAESVLPISDSTLRYGSSDGGKLVKDGSDCPPLRDLMKTIGTTLNLAGHWCGLGQKREFLFGPVDVEGHVGTDGRYYVIDLARVFPPTAEEDVSKTFLYRVFRPEFVRKYKIPLSSDAFAKFSKGAEDAEEHNQRIREATRHLLQEVVPEFARWLEATPAALLTEHPLSDLAELAHREGINVRYLGLVRHHLQSPNLRHIVLMELITRIIKNNLNEELRMAVFSSPNRGEHNYFPIALKYFNLIMGTKDNSDIWWKTTLKRQLIATYKLECLDEMEKSPETTLNQCQFIFTL